jgi:Alpha-galactosidases/6-phospho-beta-glucosidases, family 4 of glycosyl hydrolases
MLKTVIIGAGSGFGARLSLDIMSRECLMDSEICLVDIHEGRLNQVASYLQNTIDHYKLPTKLRYDTDRTKMLEDANFVITSISAGGGAYYGNPYNNEVAIPAKYGIEQSVADTISVGAVFRFLRTAPVHLQILRDVEKYAPNALHLNHTNPMSTLTMMHNTMTKLKTVGLCHGIIDTNSIFSNFLGVDKNETQYKVAGINHLAWFLSWGIHGEDMYKKLDAALADVDNPKTQEFMKHESVRLEIYKQFGYVPTESNHHDSEYMPYFRRNAETMAEFHLNKKELRYELGNAREWMKDGAGEVIHGQITRSHEYTTGIMEGVVTDVPFRFNGNVMNTGLITNLPAWCSVEVPCFADVHGINTTYCGELPNQLASLNRSAINEQQLAVEAFMNKDKESAFRACAVDPCAASILTLAKIREMFDELWEANKDHLLWYDKNHIGSVPEICAQN